MPNLFGYAHINISFKVQLNLITYDAMHACMHAAVPAAHYVTCICYSMYIEGSTFMIYKSHITY